MKQASFAKLFDRRHANSSFQNKILLYMLYKCGGFIPTCADQETLITENAIPCDGIVVRHGTERKEQFKRILSRRLYKAVEASIRRERTLSLTDHQKWKGGYFGFPGPDAGAPNLSDDKKKSWRKEYLPGPTALLASAFCSSLVGVLSQVHPADERLRVTLHRAISFGTEEVLQQACDYAGIGLDDQSSTGGRTFPAANATIGLAYSCRQVVRSKRGISRLQLRKAMDFLRIHDAASKMNKDVGFVLAIPLLEPETRFSSPQPVSGVIFIDSTADKFFVDDRHVRLISSMAQNFLNSLVAPRPEAFGRVRNFLLSSLKTETEPARQLPKSVRNVLELVTNVSLPRSSKEFQLNFDYSDFTLIRL
jgi:hypothetical protein